MVDREIVGRMSFVLKAKVIGGNLHVVEPSSNTLIGYLPPWSDDPPEVRYDDVEYAICHGFDVAEDAFSAWPRTDLEDGWTIYDVQLDALTCPTCGQRPVSEFTYVSDVTERRVILCKPGDRKLHLVVESEPRDHAHVVKNQRVIHDGCETSLDIPAVLRVDYRA